MDIGPNSSAGHSAFAPVYIGYDTESWIADENILQDVKERLLAHITSAPSDLKLNTEPESSEDWLTEYAPLAQAGHDTLYFLCGVGTLVGGIVLRQLTSFLDPGEENEWKSRIWAS